MATKKTPKTKAKKPAAKKAAKPAAKAKSPRAKSPTTGTGPAVPPKRLAAQPADVEHVVPGGVFVGRVEDYFAHVGVVALTLSAPLSVGDMIRVKGHTTDITQKVESLQINHQSVQTASPKDAIGIRVADRARKGDAIYKI